MTVKQLKEAIADLPDTMDVFVAERKTEFAYGLVNDAYVKRIDFMEEPDGKVLSSDNCLVLDEE